MRTGLAALAVAAVAGCGGTGGLTPPGWQTGAAWDVDAAAALAPPDDPLAAALHEGYVQLARTEIADHDWVDGALFVARARATAAGELPVPREAPAIEGMAEAGAPLTAYLDAPGARLRAARQIGEAQVSWDCWVGEAAEERGRQDVTKLDACRERYLGLIALIRDLAQLPADMVVVLPEEGEVGGIELKQGERTVALDRAWAGASTGDGLGELPLAEAEIREAFGAALGARPKPPAGFGLTFDFGSAQIGDGEYGPIMAIADEARSRDAAEVLVTGHADAPGSTAGNLAISRARAEAVRQAVTKELRRGESPVFLVTARGEHDPAVDTPRVERQNRRVVVTVR